MNDPIFRCPRSALVVFPQVFVEYGFESLPDLPDGATILDLGANVGAFSWSALRRYPRAKVIAYEPHPITCEMLRGNMGDLVEVHEAAVVHPKTTETARLFEGINANTECSLRDDVRWPHVSQDLTKSTEVKLIDAADLPACDLLKCDTEGSEVEILTGYKHLAGVQVLLVECHAVGGDLKGQQEKVVQIAAAAGLHPIDLRGTTIRFARAAHAIVAATEDADGWLLVEAVGGSRWLGKGPANFKGDEITVTLRFAHELSTFRSFYPVPIPGDPSPLDGDASTRLATGEMTVETAWTPYGLPGNHTVTLRWSTFERVDSMSDESKIKLLSRLGRK